MRFIVRTILGFTILSSLTVLGLSAWPGVLDDLLFIAILSSVLWFPLGVIGAIITGVILLKRHRQGRLSRASPTEMLAIPVVAILTLALLIFYIPRRIAFLACRSSFEAATADTPTPANGLESGGRLGIYRVDRLAVDPRGGTYFRVHSGPDGIGPDTMSYGFVKRPNPEGTPFGAAGYEVFHLVDDWYWFRTSDDWH